MDHLSSCYFCGTALDDSLRQYRVVPSELQDETVATVTLCRSCHEKLERVLGPVVAAAGHEAATVTLDATARAPGTSDPSRQEHEADEADRDPEDAGAVASASATAAGGSGQEVDDRSGSPESDPEAEAPDDAGDGDGESETRAETATEDSEAELEPGGGEGLDDTDESDRLADVADGNDRLEDVTDQAEAGRFQGADDEGGDTAERDGESEDDDLQTAMEPDIPDALETTGHELAGGSGTDSESSAGSPEDGGDDKPGHGDPADSTGGAESGEVSDRADDGSRDTGAGQSITALEYNKVMRLLQNREFPVDRAEIETVAASAYELAQSDCSSVIDLAIDRGLIDEKGGELIRPDDEA